MKIDNIIRPVIFVLIGLPGSGKSTWTQKLLNTSDKKFVIVSSDAELDKIAANLGKTYSEVFRDNIGQATGAMKATASSAIKAKANIVWDQTNMSKKKRRGILQNLPNEYYKIAVDFSVDPVELKKRLDKRAAETGKFIPQNVIQDMGRSYDPPSKDEGFDEIIKVRT